VPFRDGEADGNDWLADHLLVQWRAVRAAGWVVRSRPLRLYRGIQLVSDATARLSPADDPLRHDLITDCDRLAASPVDPWRYGPGVLRADMDVDAAIAACTKAPPDQADQPRFDFQLGRAYAEKAIQDSVNGASWRQKSRAVYVKAATGNYVPAFNEIGIATYDDGSKDKEYKQVLVALYARYVVATAGPMVAGMIADGSVRDHPAAARFLLEQAVSFGDIDSELLLSELGKDTKVVATDSAKQAHYLPAITGVQAWFGSVADCVEAAVSGRWNGRLA